MTVPLFTPGGGGEPSFGDSPPGWGTVVPEGGGGHGVGGNRHHVRICLKSPRRISPLSGSAAGQVTGTMAPIDRPPAVWWAVSGPKPPPASIGRVPVRRSSQRLPWQQKRGNRRHNILCRPRGGGATPRVLGRQLPLPPPPNTPNCPTWTPPPQPTLPGPPPVAPPRPPPSPLLEPPLPCPPPPPPPPGASGQQLVGGVVGVQNRGVAPPVVPPLGSSEREFPEYIKKKHVDCVPLQNWDRRSAR